LLPSCPTALAWMWHFACTPSSECPYPAPPPRDPSSAPESSMDPSLWDVITNEPTASLGLSHGSSGLPLVLSLWMSLLCASHCCSCSEATEPPPMGCPHRGALCRSQSLVLPPPGLRPVSTVCLFSPLQAQLVVLCLPLQFPHLRLRRNPQTHPAQEPRG
jgi:hypothetical protein